MLQLIGQCGPLVGTRLYPAEDAPFYLKGMVSCAGAMVLVALLSLGLRFYLARCNGNAQGRGEYGEIGDEGHELVSNRAKRKEAFEYML
jgi:hypothetical protein